MINFFSLFLTANTKRRKFFAPCKRKSKTVLDSGFQAVDSKPWIPDFRYWIPDFCQRKLDSGFLELYSRFIKQKLPGFRNADSLTWGKIWSQSKFLEAVCILTLTSATPTFVNEQEYWLPTTKKKQ